MEQGENSKWDKGTKNYLLGQRLKLTTYVYFLDW